MKTEQHSDQSMQEAQIREALNSHWRASAAGDTNAEHDIYDDDAVRREKALDYSGCKSCPGTGSFHPVAIEAVVEATKLLKPSMERVVLATRRACRP